METSIILNIVFISLVSIGFVYYQIWIGSRLVRLKKENVKLKEDLLEQGKVVEEKENNLYNFINKEMGEIIKTTDKIDSRLDSKVTKIYEDFESHNRILSNSLSNRIDELEKIICSKK